MQKGLVRLSAASRIPLEQYRNPDAELYFFNETASLWKISSRTDDHEKGIEEIGIYRLFPSGSMT
jgi:hypothetical protein